MASWTFAPLASHVSEVGNGRSSVRRWRWFENIDDECMEFKDLRTSEMWYFHGAVVFVNKLHL